MRQIRNSVFETNSSSTHTLTLTIQSIKEFEQSKILNIYLWKLCTHFSEPPLTKQDRAILLFGAFIKGIYNVPIYTTENYFEDRYIIEGSLPSDVYNDEENVRSYFHKTLLHFLGSNHFKNFKEFMKDYGGYENIIEDITDTQKGRLFTVLGLKVIFDYVEYNTTTGEINTKNLSKFLNGEVFISCDLEPGEICSC